MKKIHVLLLAVSAVLFSCSKDDNNEQPVNQTEAEKLQANLAAKWELDPELIEPLLPRLEVPAPVTVGSNAFFGKLSTTNGNTQTNDANPPENTPVLTFVEFYSDSTYVVSYQGSLVAEGKWKALSGDSIVLNPLGSFGGIKINNGKLEGRLHYTELSVTVPVIGTLVPALSTSNRTNDLCREWYIAREENYTEAYDDEVDYLTVRFSNNGTYLVKGFRNNDLVEVRMMNWKWYPNDESKMYYFDVEDPNDLGTVVIRSLSKDVLKLSEFYNMDDQEGDEEVKFTLYPAKK